MPTRLARHAIWIWTGLLVWNIVSFYSGPSVPSYVLGFSPTTITMFPRRWKTAARLRSDAPGMRQSRLEGYDDDDTKNKRIDSPEQDTIRVRIWQVIANGQEYSLRELGSAIGHHQDLKSHLKHVAKQAETLRNKSNAWMIRRGLLPSTLLENPQQIQKERKRLDKRRIHRKRGTGKKKHEIYIRFE